MKRWYLVLLAATVILALAVPVLGTATPGWVPGDGPPWARQGGGAGGPGLGPPWAQGQDQAGGPGWMRGGGPGMGPHRGGEIMAALHTKVHEALAVELGLTVTDLDAALQSGRTLADLAKDKGVSLDTLTDRVKSIRAAYITEQVAASTLTKEQGEFLLGMPGPGGPGMMGGTRAGFGPGKGFGPPGPDSGK